MPVTSEQPLHEESKPLVMNAKKGTMEVMALMDEHWTRAG